MRSCQASTSPAYGWRIKSQIVINHRVLFANSGNGRFHCPLRRGSGWNVSRIFDCVPQSRPATSTGNPSDLQPRELQLCFRLRSFMPRRASFARFARFLPRSVETPVCRRTEKLASSIGCQHNQVSQASSSHCRRFTVLGCHTKSLDVMCLASAVLQREVLGASGAGRCAMCTRCLGQHPRSLLWTAS